MCNSNATLRDEKETISAHFQALKGRMNKFRDMQAKRLSSLTKNARLAKGAVGSNRRTAERVLQLAEMARKLETDEEKVLPFYESTAEAEARAADSTARVRADAEAEMTAEEMAGLSADAPSLPFQVRCSVHMLDFVKSVSRLLTRGLLLLLLVLVLVLAGCSPRSWRRLLTPRR